MNLVLIGLNHKTASVDLRECLAPPAGTLEELHHQALALPGVREVLLVSTCNRVEVLAVAEEAGEAQAGLEDWLAQGKPVARQDFQAALYRHQDQEAVRHLFRVAASLDSLVVGEPQILGQIKEAYRVAAEAGATRTVLNKLLHKTFQVAKRVRSETRIGGSAVSVSYAAVELAKKIFDELKGLKALLVGAGEMAELAAEHLLAQGVGEIIVANRTLERAVELTSRLGGGAAYSLEGLERALAQVDIVISSTGASQPVITWEMARRCLKARRGRPLFFIDIAVPRDVEPKVGELDGCFVYDMDDLTQVVEHNRAGRAGEAQAAEAIVAEEVVKFTAWLRSLSVIPTIAELTGKAEELRQAELARTLKDLGTLAPEQAEALERLTKSLVKKLLHDPIRFIRDQGHKSDEAQRTHLALARRVFSLSQDDQD
ncbi:MAG: glutamyl-tRNA reductase [Desulfarculus sp.]|nr:glutamyl-tRNA reductase [Desulfarculus sp.]